MKTGMKGLCTILVLAGALILTATPVRAADFEAGQHAWDAGQTEEALTEWRAAAEAGDRRAMLALGRLHLQGLGVVQDYVEAHKWLNLAASRGEAAALEERDALASKMTPAQVATAQQRAAAWRPGASGMVRQVQADLARLGYEPGPVDGSAGRRTTEAVKRFQSASGLEVDGRIGAALVARLQAAVDAGKGTATQPRPEKAQAASKETPAAAPSAPVAVPEPKCAGASEGAGCWEALANKPGCHVWVSYLVPEEHKTVTWYGACVDGFADGPGTLAWSDGGTAEGPFVDANARELDLSVCRRRHPRRPLRGRQTARNWTFRYADGDTHEGPFVDGERHGYWTFRFADETTFDMKGPYVDGKKHGGGSIGLPTEATWKAPTWTANSTGTGSSGIIRTESPRKAPTWTARSTGTGSSGGTTETPTKAPSWTTNGTGTGPIGIRTETTVPWMFTLTEEGEQRGSVVPLRNGSRPAAHGVMLTGALRW